MPIPIWQIATFASEPFRGNPAWVIYLDRECPEAAVQKLCRHLGEPMIAVLAKEGDEIALRFITSEGTHPGAGHATHAAAWVAFHTLRPHTVAIDFRLNDGKVRKARRETDRVCVDWPVMAYDATDRIVELENCLGKKPIETFTSPFGLIGVFGSEKDIMALRPDAKMLSRLPENVVMATAPASSADFSVRVFAPKVGLPEDPVCGTAHRILVPFWAERLGQTDLTSYQFSPRGGALSCRLMGDIVTISGSAVPVIDGEFRGFD